MSGTKLIPLSRGLFATVDESDYDWLITFGWRAQRTESAGVEKFYAATTVNGKTLLMHRMLLGAGKGEVGDHEDRNGLNNTRGNLRKTTQASNSLNRMGRRRASASRFKGVWWHKQNSRWVADFRGSYIGSFDKEEDAARAYDAVAMSHDPEFALTNFMPNGSERDFHVGDLIVTAPPRQNSSAQKGVTWNKRRRRWVVQVRGRHVGVYEDEQDAVWAARIALEE